MPTRLGQIATVAGSLGLGFLALTLPFWVWPIDLTVQNAFFDPTEGWHYGDALPFELLYDYGVYPAYTAGAGAALLFALGFAAPALARWRRVAAYLGLCLAIGPGLVVNVVFKDHWGRPRPRQVQEFGGAAAFEKVWTHDASSSGRSFPSGHAAAGFYFLAATPLLWRRRRRLALVATAGALGFGASLGLARMAQGGHFLSDVLWSAVVCALTSAVLFFALQLHRWQPPPGYIAPLEREIP